MTLHQDPPLQTSFISIIKQDVMNALLGSVPQPVNYGPTTDIPAIPGSIVKTQYSRQQPVLREVCIIKTGGPLG